MFVQVSYGNERILEAVVLLNPYIAVNFQETGSRIAGFFGSFSETSVLACLHAKKKFVFNETHLHVSDFNCRIHLAGRMCNA